MVKINRFLVMVICISFLLVSKAYSGGVTDNNNGNSGDILISTGQNNGSNSIGHWTDITTIPELKGEKGDKGDKGDTGEQGIQGIQGDKGDIGLQGQNGLNGLNGLNGEKGDTGDIGLQGESGLDGYTPIKDLDYFDGKDGEKGDTGEIDQKTLEEINNNTKNITETNNKIEDLDNRVGDLEKTQHVIVGEVRIYDSKKWKVKPFARYNFTRNKVDTIGVKLTYKLGRSYEEKLIETQNARLEAIENKLAIPETVLEREIIKDRQGNVISEHLSISENKI